MHLISSVFLLGLGSYHGSTFRRVMLLQSIPVHIPDILHNLMCADLDSETCSTQLYCYDRTENLLDVDWRTARFGLSKSSVAESESPDCVVRYGGCAPFTRCQNYGDVKGLKCCQRDSCNVAIFSDPSASTTKQSAVLSTINDWL